MTEVNIELLFFDVTYGDTLHQIFMHVLFCATFLGTKVRHNLAFSMQLPLSSQTALYIDRTTDLPVLIPTSAPRPSLQPPANLVLALWNTQALSTKVRNLSAASTGKLQDYEMDNNECVQSVKDITNSISLIIQRKN